MTKRLRRIRIKIVQIIEADDSSAHSPDENAWKASAEAYMAGEGFCAHFCAGKGIEK
ncbi:MAG: hypothetical protein LUC98_14410 [Lachnospiraceae bacterium]|nr:hypothetical protein [Lachnospiraceae bacterium]